MEVGLESADRKSGGSRLTARERDCLQLLARGLLAAEVTAELGISQSTLDAHLASARRKLDARTTLQAVLRFAEEDHHRTFSNSAPESEMTRDWGELSETQVALYDKLRASHSFTQAWRALNEYFAHFGVGAATFGVFTDPVGTLDLTNVKMWTTMPEPWEEVYEQSGGVRADNIARHIATSTRPLVLNAENSIPLLKAMLGGVVPPTVEFLLDHQFGQTVSLPCRDPITKAPLGANLAFGIASRREFEAAASTHLDGLSLAVELFWELVQRRALLASTPKLSPREKEALQFVARGFAVAELAERIHVSQRAAEQFLARARTKLGALNNTQAIYRAMVYRALL